MKAFRYSLAPIAWGRSETVTTTRDANANVLSETDGLGRTTSYTYNSFSEPLTIQDPTQVTTTNTYTATGDLATTSRPLVGGGQTQTVTYNHTDRSHPGDVTSMVDADNFTWTYTSTPTVTATALSTRWVTRRPTSSTPTGG